MEDVLNKAKVTGIDGVYIPVANRKVAEEWYVEHLGLKHGGDYLLAGKQEVFLRERVAGEALSFKTKEWLSSGESYEMPFVCFQASDIEGLYGHLRAQGIRIGELIIHSWFKEFDFYDPDGNKLKIWQPTK